MQLNLTWDGTYLCDKHLEEAGDTCEAVALTIRQIEEASKVGTAPMCDACFYLSDVVSPSRDPGREDFHAD